MRVDGRDAIRIAQDFRDGRLVLIHIPTEEDERVRDLVRCRETFQREIIKSRHYILKFLRRRGFIYRDGTHWTTRHMNWIRQVLQPGVVAEEDQDPSVIAHAWKCQHRLYKVYHRLANKKPKQVAATAVAREMVGFLWAVLNDLDVTQLQQSEVHRTA